MSLGRRYSPVDAVQQQRSRDIYSSTLAVFLAIVLVVCVPLYLLNAATDHGLDAQSPFDGTWALQGIVIIWSGVRLASIYWVGKPTLIKLTFWLYTYVFLGIAPFAQMFTGIMPSGSMTRENELTTTTIVLVGMAAYEIGHRIAKPAIDAFDPTVPLKQFNMHRVWLLAGLGLIFTVMYVVIVGPSSLFQLRNDRASLNQDAFGGSQLSSIVSALATMPTLVALLGFIDAKRRGEKGYLFILSLLLVVLLVLTNPISSSRFWFGVVVGSIAIVAFSLSRTKKRFRGMLIVATIVLLVIFPYADKFRKAVTMDAAATSSSLATLLSGKLDYDSYAQIALTDRYVASEGHTLGRQALGALIAPLPRAWWPNKPDDTGILLANYAGYAFTSISAPLWAEAWIDGGWPWLIAVFGFLGYISRKLDDRYSQALVRGGGIWYSAVPVFALYQIMTLRGSFLQQTPRLMLFIIFFWWVAGRSARAKSPANLLETGGANGRRSVASQAGSPRAVRSRIVS